MDEIIRIQRLSYGSSGIGQSSQGKTVFVDNTVPGDLVRVRIDEKKASYDIGSMVEIVEASDDRTVPSCPFYAKCGGCSWQHITYKAQCAAKQQAIFDSLVRIGHFEVDFAERIVRETLPSKKQFGYRNKLELGTGYDRTNRLMLGFRESGKNNLASIDSCMLASPKIEKSPHALQGVLRYLQGSHDLKLFRVGVRHSVRTKDTEVALWTEPGSFPRKIVAQTIQSALTCSSVVRVISTPGKSRVVKQVESLNGKGCWEEQLGDVHFKTSAPSFFQVNSTQAHAMIEWVCANLALPQHARVADLYAGGGTFSIPLAFQCNEVIAVEAASSSVKDLRRNADLNGVDIEIIGGDSARELKKLGQLDALVVDPPRTGLAKGVIADIAYCAPQKVAYISCNPSTWARDMALFKEQGYTLTQVQPFDLFPQTYHVEIVSILSKIEKSKYIPVSIELGDNDLTKAESKATYEEIKQYVLDNNGFKVSQLYVTQIKRKHGLVERTNYNTGSGKSKVPKVPPEKEKAIEDALRYFKMIQAND